MPKIKIYDEEEYRMYDDLENYYPGITTECFKDWEEMKSTVNSCYGRKMIEEYVSFNIHTGETNPIKEQAELDEIAQRTYKLRTFRNAIVERWVNDNIVELIDAKLDGLRCDLDMELEHAVFNIVDGLVKKEGYFMSKFVLGCKCFIPQALVDFIKKR